MLVGGVQKECDVAQGITCLRVQLSPLLSVHPARPVGKWGRTGPLALNTAQVALEPPTSDLSLSVKQRQPSSWVQNHRLLQAHA
jgi:hypothetical protein